MLSICVLSKMLIDGVPDVVTNFDAVVTAVLVRLVLVVLLLPVICSAFVLLSLLTVV